MSISYAECTARARLAHVLDAGSFHEWLPPQERITSPHLEALGVPPAFDDGVVIGHALLGGRPVMVAAQEGAFLGGGVGEVHGAKLVGLLRRALSDRPAAVLLLVDSGGVRLHEANAGLIGVSEVMRALLDLRAAGVPTLVLIGGNNGCFGGMGIVAQCADHIVLSDTGRLALSGPEVIEASRGVDEFDSRDRALVWRTTGGKHRWILGDCSRLVDDDVQAFRTAADGLLAASPSRPLSAEALEREHELLAQRLALAPADIAANPDTEAIELWSRLGVPDAARVPDLEVAELLARFTPEQDPTGARRDAPKDASSLREEGAQRLEDRSFSPPDRPKGASSLGEAAAQRLEGSAASASWQTLADRLFDGGHDLSADGDFLSGTGMLDGQAIAVAGTTGHAAVGVQLALAQARVVLDTVARHPGRHLLLLIDTQGQRLRRREELLGLNRAMAHLGKAIDFARRRGHRVLGLVYEQALSGGFITSGLIADACDALPGAEIYVMRLPAMARITKLPEAELRELSQSNPVFAPGAINYVRMGGIRRLWEGEPAEALRQALADLPRQDERARDGASRGGRRMAADVIRRVLDAT